MWFRNKKTDERTDAGEKSFSLSVPADLTAAPAKAVSMTRHLSRAIWRRLSWKWRLMLALPVAGAGLLGLTLGGLLVYYTVTLENPLLLRKQQASPSLKILARDGSVMLDRGKADDYMPLDLLPRHVVEAVIATEDRRFYEHWGVDPAGLARAAFANLRMRRFAQGGSTLTQQLAKNLYLTSERTMSRKLDELLLALWLEARLSKDEILELYLNRVYFGGGAFGVEAAARRYFDKSARELTVTESAVLAGLLKAPTKFSPSSNPVQARSRARVVISKMAAAGYLSDDEAATLIRTPIRFQEPSSSREQTGLEYAVDYILEQLPFAVRGSQRGIVVETTIDSRLQHAAQAELAGVINASSAESAASQGAIVALDPEGGIRVLVGGRSYLESQFNRATKAKRQPGSAFKTFVYLNALESGMTPESTVYDLPVVINGWSPRNENGTYRGGLSLRQALAQSVNTVAVRLHADLGTKRTIATANRLGIRSELRNEPSLALGTSEVSLLEMTAAYGVFANGGAAVAPYVIERVRTADGQLLYQRPLQSGRTIVAARHVSEMNDMLNATLVSGTGRQAAIADHPAAGKTGTSQDFRDAWFVGFTSHLVGGVWIGNDNGRPMNRIMGGTIPARVWRAVMMRGHEGREPLPLPGTTIAVPKGEPAPSQPTAQPGQQPGSQPAAARQRAATAVPAAATAKAPAPATAPATAMTLSDPIAALIARPELARRTTASAGVRDRSTETPTKPETVAVITAPATAQAEPRREGWAGFHAVFGDKPRRAAADETAIETAVQTTRAPLEGRMSLGRSP